MNVCREFPFTILTYSALDHYVSAQAVRRNLLYFLGCTKGQDADLVSLAHTENIVGNVTSNFSKKYLVAPLKITEPSGCGYNQYVRTNFDLIVYHTPSM